MATDSDTAAWRKPLVLAGKILGGVVIVLAFPIAVWRNAFGIADRLSILPGIHEQGGGVSATTSILYIGLIGMLAFGIAVIATGVVFPTGDDDGSAVPATPTPTPTVTPEATPTATPVPTPTATLTPNREARQAELEALEQYFRDRISQVGANDTRPHLLATQYRETPDGDLELWFVFDEIEWTGEQGAQNMRTQWYNTAVAWANAVGPYEGATPERLVVIGLSEKYNNTHFTIPTSEANAVWHNEMTEDAYEANWWNRIHGYPDDHGWVQTAYDMVEAEGNTPTDSLAD